MNGHQCVTKATANEPERPGGRPGSANPLHNLQAWSEGQGCTSDETALPNEPERHETKPGHAAASEIPNEPERPRAIRASRGTAAVALRRERCTPLGHALPGGEALLALGADPARVLWSGRPGSRGCGPAGNRRHAGSSPGPRCDRPVGVEAQQRVEPDQPAAGLVQPLHLGSAPRPRRGRARR